MSFAFCRTLSLTVFAAGLSAALPAGAADFLAACGLPLKQGSCGNAGQCVASARPEIADYWHGMAPCLRAVRDQWSRQGGQSVVQLDAAGHSEPVYAFARRVIVGEMRSSRVKFASASSGVTSKKTFDEVFDKEFKPTAGFDLVQLVNDLGVPYNGMGQGDMAYMLYSLAEVGGKDPGSKGLPDSSMYRRVANGAIRTAITPLNQGGLASIGACGTGSTKRCAWFHSVTRRDRESKDGLTLNQNLHVIRDLGLIADLTARTRWDESIDFEHAIDEGLNQLFRAPAASGRADDLPVLADYLAPPTGSSKVRFLYYGYGKESPKSQGGGYFLNTDGKDCNYHVHVLELLDQILERKEKKGDHSQDGSAVLGCQSPLAAAYLASVARFGSSDAAKWTGPASGTDTSCHPETAKTFKAIDEGFYASKFTTCRTAR